jgi:hypothetical protein
MRQALPRRIAAVEKANAEWRPEAKNRQMREGDQAGRHCGSLEGAQARDGI